MSMDKDEAKEFGELKATVKFMSIMGQETHNMVKDLHDSLHVNGFLDKVNKNTEFREKCEERTKWKFRTIIGAGVSIICGMAVAVFKYLIN